MIYTVTLNPALDYAVSCPEFEEGRLNVYTEPSCFPGGKGINVSLLLNELGTASVSMGLAAGFTGDQILRMLEEKGIAHDFLKLRQGISRVNFKICAESETEINGAGPRVSQEEASEFLQKLGRVQQGDTLVLAGSQPASLADDYYERILAGLDSGVLTVVDATGQKLWRCLKYAPFLVKPNHIELGELFGCRISTPKDAEIYGRKLIGEGARNVLVSMGSMGAVLVNDTVRFMPAVKGRAVSSCGAGDSMVAGFIYGYSLSRSYDEALKWGTAAGAATAFSKGIATGGFIRETAKKVQG